MTDIMEPLEQWLTRRAADVTHGAEKAIKRYAWPRQVKIFDVVQKNSKVFAAAQRGAFVPAIHLPLLVYAGIRGEEKRAIHLAASLLLLEIGIYTFDHILDDELEAPLDELPRSLTALAAVSFLSFLPQQTLSNLDSDGAVIAALHRILARGLARVCEGQLMDVGTVDSKDPCPEEIEAAICGKTGERRAMFAEMAAYLAAGSRTQIEAYTGYARSLGIARQLTSDLQDLFGREESRDLANGTRTLPIALYLAQSHGESKRRMLILLNRARHDPGVRSEIRDRLRESGAMRQVFLRREIQCQRALRLLGEAQPLEPAGQRLAAAVKAISLASVRGSPG